MSHLNRRAFLGYSTLATAGLFTDGLLVPAWAQDTRGLPATPAIQTNAGRVRGVVRFGVSQFFGVPYGASTAGANRFMPRSEERRVGKRVDQGGGRRRGRAKRKEEAKATHTG